MTDAERQEMNRLIWGEDGNHFDREMFDIFVAKMKEEHRDQYFGIAIELWMAGWKSEPLREHMDVMSWYWRRPPRPGRKKGRLFLSTDQAYRQMRKEAGLPPEP
jgi:hypothetical protein